jgi:hypothetical protein
MELFMNIHPPTHTWLKKLSISQVSKSAGKLSDQLVSELLIYLQNGGHTVQETPSGETDVILTTAKFGEPLNWREALMFTARHRYKLDHNPTVFTILEVEPEQLDRMLADIGQILENEQEPGEKFQGVPESAHKTLFEQGKRGGAILYLARVLQTQSKCIRIILVIGKNKIDSVYLFDLVGAHPHIINDSPTFIKDIATRIATAVSTKEITQHSTVPPVIPQSQWQASPTIQDMIVASNELGKRDFFTEMIKINNLAAVPGFNDVISQQYSEGCFATWDKDLGGLLTTITGSARPIRKESITENDLALIVGVKPENDGALVRHLEGHPNYPPSSEAVEMVGVDLMLPRVLVDDCRVPVIRSKLHGHRGVRSFHKDRVEYAPLSENYLYYPVSCSTDAQCSAVQEAFSRASALQDPEDPRNIVFTVLPGHGCIIVEKWIERKRPFQLIWEAMDRKDLEISNDIPQGHFGFEARGQRLVILGSR